MRDARLQHRRVVAADGHEVVMIVGDRARDRAALQAEALDEAQADVAVRVPCRSITAIFSMSRCGSATTQPLRTSGVER